MTGPPERLSDKERERFDALMHDLIESLPARLRGLVDEVPIIVLDRPDAAMVKMLQAEGTLGPEDDGLDVCGLHSGVGLPDRSIDDPSGAAWGAVGGGPEHIHLFREGIIGFAFDAPPTDFDELDPDEQGAGPSLAAFRGNESLVTPNVVDNKADPAWDWGDEWPADADERIYEEIRITLLHEIGHHFGLDEDDLEELGYQ